jgi:hypothetical protein
VRQTRDQRRRVVARSDAHDLAVPSTAAQIRARLAMLFEPGTATTALIGRDEDATR